MILLICGSPRPTGLTSQILDLIESLLRQREYRIRRTGVYDLGLPIFGLDDTASHKIAEWRQSVQQASALIFGSPEYHGSFSGGLKNLLDYLDKGMLEGKPSAIVAAAGGARAGVCTLNAMRIVLRNLHAAVIVQQLAVSQHDLRDGPRVWSHDALSHCTTMVEGLLGEVALRQPPTTRNIPDRVL